MNYTSIENDIVARLAPLVSAGYEVEAMPDNDGSNIPAARKGRITVQVGMVKFLEHKSISSAVVQDEEIYVEIIVRSRKLRATGGVYDLTELCRALLIGYTPTNCKVMLRGVDWGGITPSERFDGIWTYSLRLATQSVSVGSADEDISVLISQITLLDGFSIDAPTPTIEIYASAYNVDNSGDQVIIAWVSTNADEVTISGLGVVAANGTATITMSVNTTFTATASNAYGDDSALINVTVGATCEDAIIELNGVQVATVASGATENFSILNGGGNAVGTWDGTSLVVANNYTEINGVQVTDQPAEEYASIAVELDGNPSGTWNAGTQTWEVTSDPCLDGNIELNGVAVATVASGGTEDIPVLSEGSNPVGSLVGSDWVIENNATTINGVQVTDQEAEQDAAIFVTRDGVQNGTWNAGIQTWEVTSAACSPVTFQINAVNKESLSSGTTFNLITKLDGSVNSGSYDAPTDTLSFTSAATPPPSVSLAISDITPDLGQVITLTATAVNFTPTLYQFLLFNGSITLLAEQAGNIFNWTVNATAGSYDIYVLATDGTSNEFSFTSIVVQGDPDADAFIIATGITNPTIISAISTLVLNFKTYGIWTKMSAIYPLVGGTATTHKFNLKNPLDTNGAYRLVFNGGITHNSDGITGNGSNAYANTFLTDVSLDINNKHISIYQRNILLDSYTSMGAGGSANNRFYLNLGGQNYSTLGMFQSPVAVITPQRGMFTMSKVISGAFKYYQNALTPSTRTGTNASSISNYTLLADTGGSNPSAANLSFASIGQGLSDTESANLYTSVQAFQTTLGRQV